MGFQSESRYSRTGGGSRFRFPTQTSERVSLSTLFFLTTILIFGVLIRLDFLVASNFVIDSDEAIVGLMAKHIAEGASIPVFYYGQHYMGSLEPLLLSVLFQIFGVVPWMIKLVPLFFSLCFIGIMFAIGVHLGGRRAGCLAAILTALPPSALVTWSHKARGGFIEIVCIGALVTLLSLWWIRAERFEWPRLFVIAFLLGFGWWTNNQIVYFYPAVGFMVLIKSFSVAHSIVDGIANVAKATALSIAAALLGALPFCIYNVQYPFASFTQLFRDRETVIIDHLTGFFSTALPILLGAKRYWQTEELFAYSNFIFFFLYTVLFLLALRSGLHKERLQGPLLFLLCVLLCASAIFVLSPYGYLSEAPRYLLPLYVPIIALAVLGLDAVFSISVNVGRFLLGLILVLNLSSSYLHDRAIPGEPFVFKGERVSANHDELYAWLEEHSIEWIRTNYWIGYRVAYETKEAVRFLVFQLPTQTRIADYEIAGKEFGVEKIPFVLVPSQAQIVRDALDFLQYRYQETTQSGYEILYDITPSLGESVEQIEYDELRSTSQYQSEKLKAAFDGDLETRWGSGAPQNGSMEIEIRFEKPTRIGALGYKLGEWSHDFPRKLSLIGFDSSGVEHELIAPSQYDSVRYIGAGDSWRGYFPPKQLSRIVLRQQGTHPILDWSIAELEVFRYIGRDDLASVP